MDHVAQCSEPSDTNDLLITRQLRLTQAKIRIQHHINQIPAGRIVFRVL